jgi:tRNA (Thr-GGU) A37 N-methylase
VTYEPLQVVPIGHVVNDVHEVSDDYWGGVSSIIRLDAERFPPSTVQGLGEFSHLLVTFHFHLIDPAQVHLGARSPRDNPGWPATGTFVHRNMKRPNRLGVSFPRLLSIDGLDLHVQDLDAVDGTPVIDVAPFFREFGPQGPTHQPAWPTEMLLDYWASRDR